MKVTPFPAVLALLGLVLAAVPAQAQRRAAAAPVPRFGPHLGYNLDYEELLIGAQMSWRITPRAALYPSFDYYFVDPGSLWSLNADVKFIPPSQYGMLYVGGGLNYSRASIAGNSAADTGVNLFVGFEGRRLRAPYLEARFIVNDDSSLQIVGGFSFGR